MALNQHQLLSDAEIREKKERERLQLANRMHFIYHKILILSGKGGVGKSTVSANLAIALAQSGNHVGLLDIDVHGPSIPKMLNMENGRIVGPENDLLPIELDGNLEVMSIGFLLKNRDDAVIVRGPMKYHTIRQSLANVAWGELDYLIIDSPPGTGDEPLTIAQSIENLDGAIIITTPQSVAVNDVRKSITFCRKLKLPVVGVLENMSGFTCPHCGRTIDIFSGGGVRRMAEDMNVPFLGRIPLDPAVVVSGDSGTPIIQASPDSPAARAFREAVGSIMNRCGEAA